MTFTIYYLITDKTPLLEAAYNASLDYENISSEYISKDELMKLTIVKESCTYVLSYFDREPYYHLASLTNAIYGPQVILHYLREGRALPVWQCPLYSTALMNACVSVTSISTDLRDKLSEKIKILHGRYSKDLTEKVNVIITTKVGSKKYLVGAERGIKMVLPEWVDEALNQSVTRDPINFMSEIILEQFKTPTLCKLSITVSGIPAEDRLKISELIKSSGGDYDSELMGKKTTHLIINKVGGAKYDFAKRWKLQIVTLDWLLKSIEKGYALNEDDFRLEETNMFSTPCRNNEIPSLPGSDLSCIPHEIGTSRIAESRLDVTTVGKIFNDLFFNFANSSASDISRLRPLILKNGGKIADSISEAVTSDITHVLVGNMTNNYIVSYAIPGVNYVKQEWIEKCLETMRILPVEDFSVRTHDQVEIDELNKLENFSKTATGLDDGNDDLLSLINQYGESQETLHNTHDFIAPSSMEIKRGFFEKTLIYLSDELNEYQSKQCRQKISSESGIITSDIAKARIKIYPFFTKKNLSEDGTCITWCGFLKHCETKMSILRLLEESFLYRPIERESDDLPLANQVFSITGFLGDERNWLSEYLSFLGAHIQDSFVRRDMPEKNLKGCDCLLVQTREGKKYEAALKWNLPVYDLDWLKNMSKSLEKSKINVEEFSTWSSTRIEKENIPPISPQAKQDLTIDRSITKRDKTPPSTVKSSLHNLPDVETPKNTMQQVNPDVSICNTPVSAFLTAGVPYIPKNLVKGNIDNMFKTPEWMKEVQKSQPQKDWRDIDLATVLVWDPSDFENQQKQSSNSEESQKEILNKQDFVNTPVLKNRQEAMFNSPQVDLTTKSSSGSPTKAATTLISSLSPSSIIKETQSPMASNEKMPTANVENAKNDPTFDPINFNFSTPICNDKPKSSVATVVDRESVVTPVNEATDDDDDDKSMVMAMNSRLKEILSSNKETDDSLTEHETSSVRARRKRCLDSESNDDDKGRKKFRKVDSNEKNKIGDVFWKYEDHSQPNMPPETTSPVQLKKTEYEAIDELERTKLTDTQPKKPTQEVKQMAFSFLNLSPAYKDKLEATVINLGCKIVENDLFAEQATHLIASTPVRNERYLIALATGKWILHPSYIEACESSSKFLSEEPYEWGSVGTEPLLRVILGASPLPSKAGSKENAQFLSKQKKLKSCAHAASYWRKKGGNAFDKWKVIFYPDSWDKAAIFKKIIIAGGGHVYSSVNTAPQSEVTHAFHKSKNDKNLPPNFNWKPIDYLSEYLIESISI